jgi:hypothetical protein
MDSGENSETALPIPVRAIARSDLCTMPVFGVHPRTSRWRLFLLSCSTTVTHYKNPATHLICVSPSSVVHATSKLDLVSQQFYSAGGGPDAPSTMPAGVRTSSTLEGAEMKLWKGDLPWRGRRLAQMERTYNGRVAPAQRARTSGECVSLRTKVRALLYRLSAADSRLTVRARVTTSMDALGTQPEKYHPKS